MRLLTVLLSVAESAQAAKMQDFTENDPWGGGVTIISMTIVLLALMVIYFVFKALGPVIDRATSLKSSRVKVKKRPAAVAPQGGSEAEIAAVIGLALHQHMQAMREDDVVNLTIKEIARRYSPWNDKRHAMTGGQIFPRKVDRGQ